MWDLPSYITVSAERKHCYHGNSPHSSTLQHPYLHTFHRDLPACLLVCLPVCLSVCLSGCLSACLSTCLSARMSVEPGWYKMRVERTLLVCDSIDSDS